MPDEGSLVLGDNYPNPFDNFTTLPVTIPNAMDVEIQIFDLLGRYIQTVVSEQLDSGYYEIRFDTHDLSAGMYFYRLVTNDEVITQKMVKVM